MAAAAFAVTPAFAGDKDKDHACCATGEKMDSASFTKLNLSAEAIDVESRPELWWQNFYDDVATELDLARDEDARHAGAAQLLNDRVPGTQCLLKALGEIIHRFLAQVCSAVGELVPASINDRGPTLT